MPVKWTPEKDQMLLLKILETHDFKVDTNRVVKAWPENYGDAPTPRAIQERLARIRADARKAGAMPAAAIKASVSTPRKSGAKSAPVTPVAHRNGNSNGAAVPATDLKRKREFVKPEPFEFNGLGGYAARSIEEVDLTDGPSGLRVPPARPDVLDQDVLEESPLKKARVRRSTSRADISYAESDREDASGGSDYHVDFDEEEELV